MYGSFILPIRQIVEKKVELLAKNLTIRLDHHSIGIYKVSKRNQETKNIWYATKCKKETTAYEFEIGNRFQYCYLPRTSYAIGMRCGNDQIFDIEWIF